MQEKQDMNDIILRGEENSTQDTTSKQTAQSQSVEQLLRIWGGTTYPVYARTTVQPERRSLFLRSLEIPK